MDYNRLLEGKKAFVSAAGAGIGRAIALTFARQGAAVAFTDIDDRAGQQTETELRAIAPESFYLHADMADKAGIEAACQEVLHRWGRIDCLVNNAGQFRRAWLHETTVEDFERMIELNYLSAVRCTRAFLPAMMAACAGTIINVSSDYAEASVPQVGAYGASKGALNAFSRAIALDYAHRGVRSNVICPGGVYTSLMRPHFESGKMNYAGMLAGQPLQGPGLADDLANTVLFLASDMSSYITGATLMQDGGAMLQAHRVERFPEPANYEEIIAQYWETLDKSQGGGP